MAAPVSFREAAKRVLADEYAVGHVPGARDSPADRLHTGGLPLIFDHNADVLPILS